MSVPERNATADRSTPFRRGRGPQEFGKPRKSNAVTDATPKAMPVLVRLRLPRTTTARGVRRAHARLIEWVLDGFLDSLTATRLSFILENIRKTIELELLEDLDKHTASLEKTAQRAGITFAPAVIDDEEETAISNAALGTDPSPDEIPT
jgi:hypothetical protein